MDLTQNRFVNFNFSLGMYSTYSSDEAFETMLKKKEKEARFLFPHSSLPSQTQVKTMIKFLNKNPSQRDKISAAKEVKIRKKI